MKPGDPIYKDPDAEKFYVWDWSKWLGAATIADHEIVISGPDDALTMDHNEISDDGTAVRVRLKGGTTGQRYLVTCRVTTNENPTQTDDQSNPVMIRQQ